MTSSMFRMLAPAALGIALLTSLVVQPALVGQEKTTKKAKGRLPPYFAQVVTEKQRSEIYAIQKKYNDQLDALEQQVKALQAQRDTEVEGVLSAEQKEKLDKLRADAASRRKAKAAAADAEDPSEPVTTTTSAAPTTTKPATATTKAANR